MFENQKQHSRSTVNPTTHRSLIRTHHGTDHRWTVHHGDVESVLQTFSPNLFHAVLADAPYGMEYMNHKWDEEIPPVSAWKRLLRTCKPGAPLLCFGGTRCFHRLM